MFNELELHAVKEGLDLLGEYLARVGRSTGIPVDQARLTAMGASAKAQQLIELERKKAQDAKSMAEPGPVKDVP